MTGKMGMSDGEGPGLSWEKERKRRWRSLGALNIAVSAVILFTLIMFRRDPASGLSPFPPEVAIAAAIGLPLLTLAYMRIVLRMMDEVALRLILDSWAASFVAMQFGVVAWLMLLAGGVLPEPPGPAVLVTMLMGSVLVMGVIIGWLRWRRF